LPRSASRPALFTEWFWVPQPRPAATLRLFCFPHAGGDARSFAALGQELPDDIEVWALRLPGRGARLRDPQPADLDELVTWIATAMLPLTTGRYALLGQSFGSIVAFEVGCALSARNPPTAAVVTALPAPHLWHLPLRHVNRGEELALLRRTGELGLTDVVPGPGPGPGDDAEPVRRMIDGLVLGALATMDDDASAVLAHPELRELALGAIRADLALCFAYRHRPGTGLTCPLYAVGGADDPALTREQLAGWSGYTSGRFEHAVVPGGHLVVQAGGGRLSQSIVAFLRSAPGETEMEKP
jgi:surfactin synthase thioesterase subunit